MSKGEADGSVKQIHNETEPNVEENSGAKVKKEENCKAMTNQEHEKESLSSTGSKANLASMFGLYNFIICVGVGLVPVISGMVADTYGDFRSTFVFHGGCLIFVAALVLMAWILHVKSQKNRTV